MWYRTLGGLAFIALAIDLYLAGTGLVTIATLVTALLCLGAGISLLAGK